MKNYNKRIEVIKEDSKKNDEENQFDESIQEETKRAFNILCKIVPVSESSLGLIKKRRSFVGIKRFNPNENNVNI